MITQNGAIKVSTALDEKMQKELTRGARAMAIVFIIIGAIGVAACLSIEVISVFLEWEEDFYYILMTVLFAVMLGTGIAYLVIINKNLNAVKSVSRVNTYEFYSSYFIITESLNGETVGSVKIYNNQIIKAKEVKNFLFFYINAGAAYPVDKTELSEAEINTLKSIFRLGFNGGTVNLTPEPFYGENLGTNPQSDTENSVPHEPEDPFGDFN